MHPIICQIGPVNVYSYGAMMAIAIVVCTFLLKRDAHSLNINSEIIFDLSFWVLIMGILGARLFFVFLNLDYFIAFPLDIIKIQNGGLVWQGGLIAGALTCFRFIKVKKLPLLATLDLVAPYLALGQSIGRIGCFFNGCCYGKEFAHGIYFPVHEAILHPTQLYSSLGLLIIFLILRKYRIHLASTGKVFFLYLILASIQRFAVEFFRADYTILNIGLSVPQVISIVVLGGGLYFFFKRSNASS